MSQIGGKKDGRDTPTASRGHEQRRGQRFAIPVAIEVSGIGRNDKAFHERTVASNVSEWGCAFPLSVELKADDIIAVRMISTTTKDPGPIGQAMFQVVRVQREKDGWAVGAWKMDGEDTWVAAIQRLANWTQPAKELPTATPLARRNGPQKVTDQ